MRLHAIAPTPDGLTDQPVPGLRRATPVESSALPTPPLGAGPSGEQPPGTPARTAPGPLQSLYAQLATPAPGASARAEAAAFLHDALARTADAPCDLPEAPDDLHAWMHAQATQAAHAYAQYLQQRRAGGPRRYFSNRAHALYFLRNVAPTKLVDGAWLYGLLPRAANPLLEPLVRTYLEELGDGQPDKNHVTLYRHLLAQHGLANDLPQDDTLYGQGLIQLALAWNAADFLPEVVGFNLGYEQLPLHLLITAYELNELGIDPYYFTLHVTVDNASTGHARQACDAVLQMLPRQGNPAAFWRRVRAGSRLGNTGRGTVAVMEGFDIAAEATRVFRDKAPAGAGLHSDYARIGGRTVNEWLAEPARMDDFLRALADHGWIAHGQPAPQSRLWNLLQGERPEMFGVFSPYELQVIHDWIRGPDSADGQAYFEPAAANQSGRRPSFRALQRLRRTPQSLVSLPAPREGAGSAAQAWDDQLQQMPAEARTAAVVAAMGPALHWTPAGLHATRLFASAWSA